MDLSNFYPNTIDYGCQSNFHTNTMHNAFWSQF